MALANPPLKFADNWLQELLHFNGIALQFNTGWERFRRNWVLQFFLKLGLGVFQNRILRASARIARCNGVFAREL